MGDSTGIDRDGIRARWSTYGGMGNDRGAEDYTDKGCRILAEHAFRDVPALLDALAEAEADRDRARDCAVVLEQELAAARDALRAYVADARHTAHLGPVAALMHLNGDGPRGTWWPGL